MNSFFDNGLGLQCTGMPITLGSAGAKLFSQQMGEPALQALLAKEKKSGSCEGVMNNVSDLTSFFVASV